MSIALMFSGQGAQKVGMGQDLYAASETARALYDEADHRLGWKLSEISFGGPEEALTETKVCQVALYVHGYAVFSVLSEKGGLDDASIAMGLSLGEVTACTAAGVFDFTTGLDVVAERSRLMQHACEQSDGSMAAVIGVDRDTVAAFCAEMGIEMANLNCPGQIVISGEKALIAEAVTAARARGFKRVLPLAVSGAYHSRLMLPAKEGFATFLQEVEFKAPRLTLISNTTGDVVTDPDFIREALIKQVVSPVLWEDCMRTAAARGAKEFWELGIGGVLKGHVKRTDRDWPNRNFETWTDLAE